MYQWRYNNLLLLLDTMPGNFSLAGEPQKRKKSLSLRPPTKNKTEEEGKKSHIPETYYT
jgi:hypothetical protein